MQQKACEIGPQTEPRLTGAVSAVSPSHRSDHGSVLFSARTLLFLVDPEKSSLGATVPQRGMVTEIRRTNHNRRPYTRATGADSSGSFLRRIRQTLNATKSVRNWTPNRAEVDRCGLGREPVHTHYVRGAAYCSSIGASLQLQICFAFLFLFLFCNFTQR